MTRTALLWTALAIGSATFPAMAQMPTTPPGAPDPARVTAGTYEVDPAHTQATFTVNHMGFSLYRGIFGDPTGSLTLDPKNPGAAKVAIDIPIARITTTNAKLDEHLKGADFFDAEKFPTATFRSTTVKVSGTKATISGNLTIKGVTKPVTLNAHFIGAGSFTNPMIKKTSLNVGFEAKTVIKRSDFGISYGIPMVPDEVPLEISVAFQKPA
jgi:polyisoprenoid-binding protein YceI